MCSSFTTLMRDLQGQEAEPLPSEHPQVISLVDALSTNSIRLASSDATCLRLTAQLHSKETMDLLGPPRAEGSTGDIEESGKAGIPATAKTGIPATAAAAGVDESAGAGVDESAEVVGPPGVEGGPLTTKGAAFKVSTAAAVSAGVRGSEAKEAKMALRETLKRTEELEVMVGGELVSCDCCRCVIASVSIL